MALHGAVQAVRPPVGTVGLVGCGSANEGPGTVMVNNRRRPLLPCVCAGRDVLLAAAQRLPCRVQHRRERLDKHTWSGDGVEDNAARQLRWLTVDVEITAP